MGEHTARPAAPTQVQYPWRATIRTATQAVIGVLVMLAARQFGLTPALAGLLNIPDAGTDSTAALVGLAAATRLMALPAVDGLLTSWGLGAGK